MTAEPAGRVMRSPNPFGRQSGGYTLEDVLKLPDDTPRVELRDGVMILVPSPTFGHQKIGNLLWLWFRQHAPVEFEPITAAGIALSPWDTFEPDVMLLRRPVELRDHYALADQVLIAVEVVSPSTRRRDRFEKPGDYAAAGITHYWRIEQDPVHVFAYDLVEGQYQLAGDSAEVLTLRKPFDVELRVRDITP